MSHPFDGLNPDLIMDAVETLGFRCDCRIFPLNSYENRVYRVGVENGKPLIAKFYRPDRWNLKQLQEEHDFCFELQAEELPILAPLQIEGKSLHKFKGYTFSLFPLQGGYAPEFSRPDTLKTLGRLVARLHNVGQRRRYKHRPTLDVVTFGQNSADFMLQSGQIPETYRQPYESLIRDLLAAVAEKFALISSTPLRVHGDCHVGNFLERDAHLYLVDFDDSRMCYAIQDLWMFLSGDAIQQQQQLEPLLEGYRTFADFNPAELQLIEAYRSLRIIHYAAWLARRQDDPAFQRYFPWFGTAQFWGEHILELREQYAALQEIPLDY